MQKGFVSNRQQKHDRRSTFPEQENFLLRVAMTMQRKKLP